MTFLDTPSDLDWLFEVHVPANQQNLRAQTVCAILTGNEDWPEKVELFNVNRYDAVPLVTLTKFGPGDTYSVRSPEGIRYWTADDADHAREQHEESFPEELILEVLFVHKGPHA